MAWCQGRKAQQEDSGCRHQANSGFGFWLHSFPNIWPRANHYTSLSLRSFLLDKILYIKYLGHCWLPWAPKMRAVNIFNNTTRVIAVLIFAHFQTFSEHKQDKAIRNAGWNGQHDRSDLLLFIFTISRCSISRVFLASPYSWQVLCISSRTQRSFWLHRRLRTGQPPARNGLGWLLGADFPRTCPLCLQLHPSYTISSL